MFAVEPREVVFKQTGLGLEIKAPPHVDTFIENRRNLEIAFRRSQAWS